MTAAHADPQDLAEFLRGHPPFEGLDEPALLAVAAAARELRVAAGTPVVVQAAPPSRDVYVVRSGAVELLEDEELLDVLGEGEMFGYASVLAQVPARHTARTAEDSVLLAIPEAAIRPVLGRPPALRFVVEGLTGRRPLLARSESATLSTISGRPVSELVRSAPLLLEPGASVQGAARRMSETGATCVVVDLGATVGIVTDHDLRTRVVAAGAGPDTPLSDVMSAPAHTVSADRSAIEALLDMLDAGVRHLPVLDAHRRLVGVVDDLDLMATERRAPFRLRARVTRAPSLAEVAAALGELPGTIVALHDASVPAPVIGRAISSVHDTATRRLIDLATDEVGRPPVRWTWLATGSYGRREPFPSSDVDNALAWEGDDDPDVRARLLAIAERVIAGLAQGGLPPDHNGALASSPQFARSVAAWERAAAGWLDEPERDHNLMLLSVVIESSPVWGTEGSAARMAGAFARAPRHEHALRRLAIGALGTRPPTGFVRSFVLESGGRRKGRLDIKHGGLLPVVNIARWAALSAGVAAASTRARVDAAEAAGQLAAGDAAVLRDTFELFTALRMEHQVEQLRAGAPPDDLIDPARLSRLTRRSLKDAFRAVAGVQRGIAVRLGLSGR